MSEKKEFLLRNYLHYIYLRATLSGTFLIVIDVEGFQLIVGGVTPD